jgi:hypothetical protein
MNSDLKFENYELQSKIWPLTGKHILAQYDEKSIIVYQAFNDKIAKAVLKNQNFHSDECLTSGYSLNRMSWVKTNFLWMMFRSNWAQSKDQERILAIRITREGFEEILLNSVKSTPVKKTTSLANGENWKDAIKSSEVRLQWDPDHHPNGDKITTGRRAIQLGLRGNILKRFSTEFILNIYDLTEFVIEQRENCIKKENYSNLLLPSEQIYNIENNLNLAHVTQ